ncbi:MAG: hypothetical protein MHPSP_000834 [Paramarteilia canceri]
MAWLNCKKVYDSVNNDEIISMMAKKQFSNWVQSFIVRALSQWCIDINKFGNPIIKNKKVDHGIIQGDSLFTLVRTKLEFNSVPFGSSSVSIPNRTETEKCEIRLIEPKPDRVKP